MRAMLPWFRAERNSLTVTIFVCLLSVKRRGCEDAELVVDTAHKVCSAGVIRPACKANQASGAPYSRRRALARSLLLVCTASIPLLARTNRGWKHESGEYVNQEAAG